jgi:uncharacterized membrane protein (UPF0182 family)
MRLQLPLAVALIVLFVVAGGLAFAVSIYFDWLWFQEINKQVIFTTILYAKSTLAAGTLLLVFLFLYVNLSFANRGPGSIQIGIPTPTGQITAYTFREETLRRIIGVASLLAALFFALREAQHWETFWRWLHRIDFGTTDPIFGRDIGFYFFSLPLLQELLRFGIFVILLAAVGVLVLYHFKGILSTGGIRHFGGRGRVRAHVSALAALFFLFLTLDAYLDRFQILYSNTGPMFGATYSDLNARLPMLTVLAVCALIGVLLWAYNAFAANNRAAIAAVILYVAVMLIGNIYPSILQKFVVAPNELARESPQIRHNIEATLKAYGLDTIQERDLSGDKALTPRDIQANAATIRSIRLWDHEPLLDAFSQIQEIRTYYDFTSVDNDRYTIEGEPRQMMLSTRELNSASLPERNWINEHLSYTHGYGLTAGPVNRITAEGLPVLLVQDIPPKSQVPVLEVKRPEIYYGELTHGYVIVKTGEKEFDYPSGDENVFTTYEGTGGVPVNSLFRKLLFAIYFKDINIVLSPLLKPESRFLYFRDLKSRLSRVAPFLIMDRDPYLVVSEGKPYWIQDGYTHDDHYPYSTPTRGVGNYIRNSVKIILDAYNGSVEFYVADPEDPLLRVYQGIFPGAFRPLSDIAPDLRNHLRYPEDIFRIQTYIYSVYHMQNPQIFYNREDLWEIPVLSGSGTETQMSPYYTIMRLPQEKQPEFILMLPFTPGRKDNLSAWMVARSDGEYYGQLVVYRFPKQKLVYGPKQIVARINQDAEISRQISLWDQRGSQVILGTLLVIPIEEALIYVRPLYLRAEAGRIPELKRVIVAYENRIAMEETLEQSIARIFDTAATPSEPPAAPSEASPAMTKTETPPPAADLARQAREAYSRAVQAQRQGDWARYGEELRKLGAILDELHSPPGAKPEVPRN